jgi:hypothetical protein
MKNSHVDRIAFYTRKVAERSKHPVAELLPRKFTFRDARLQQYKKIMNKQLIEFKKSW